MCGSGVSRQMRSKGLSGRGKITMHSKRDLGGVPCFSSRRVKRDGKARSPESSPPESPSAVKVLDAACGCRSNSSGGGHRQGVASGAWMAWAFLCLDLPCSCLPICCPPETSLSVVTINSRAWILAMMAWRFGVGASSIMIASSVPSSSSSSYASNSGYSSSSPFSSLALSDGRVQVRFPLSTVYGCLVFDIS